MTSDLRYPVGAFHFDAAAAAADRPRLIAEIETAPAALRDAVRGLNDSQLDTPYRPGGWTVRQVVHHLPDSHLHAYDRFKLALTEECPTIKPYDENRWAELPDNRTVSTETSLTFLETLHVRWVALLRAMRAEQFERGYYHPEHSRTLTLDEALASYAWHGRHHIAHITSLRQRAGW